VSFYKEYKAAMDIGILGGTFDPVHNGHLMIAEYAKDKLKLDKVLFIPAPQPPLKGRTDITPIGQRLEMLKLALDDIKEFEISTIELERTGYAYTADTLHVLKERLGPDVNLFFILGWDSLTEFPRWKNPQKIIKLGKLVAFNRPTVKGVDLTALERSVPGIISSTVFLDMPPVDISSTDIREKVDAGEEIYGLVPEKVEKYIRENGLYRQEEDGGHL
jgi:nicotinate-nucleotide adenylyltransferase